MLTETENLHKFVYAFDKTLPVDKQIDKLIEKGMDVEDARDLVLMFIDTQKRVINLMKNFALAELTFSRIPISDDNYRLKVHGMGLDISLELQSKHSENDE